MRKLPLTAAVGALALLATTAFTAEVEGVEPVDSVEATVVSDPWESTGDWNAGTGAEVGSALGQDLVSASIAYAEDVFTFVIAVAELPAIGGTPEATRYGWSLTYNGEAYELDGKFTNYSRGACDPTAGSCPPPQDPGLQTFLVRGDCVNDPDTNVTTCQELARVQATFDPSAGTITIPVPAAVFTGEAGVQGCDVIAPSASFFNNGTSIWSAPSAFVTRGADPADTMWVEIDFVVPAADPEHVCGA